jgi:hypothetical protein
MERRTVEESPPERRPAKTTRSYDDERAVRGTAARWIPRSRGAVSGLLLVLLGIWGGLIPFVGPYFGYEFGSDETWLMTWDRFWLDVLPGAVLVLGGLLLLASSRRVSAGLGAWLGVAGGFWYVIGPAMSLLWDDTLGPQAPIGAPIGSTGVQVLELLGYFYALGALATALGSFALGRLSLVAAADVERARGAPAPAAGEDRTARPRRRLPLPRRRRPTPR